MKKAGASFVVKRIYDEPADDDGCRVLVDRLWPRGVSKERAGLDLWLKDIAPSPPPHARVLQDYLQKMTS